MQTDLLELPPEFEPACYERRFADARGLGPAALERHFLSHAGGEDRNGSRVDGRTDFLRLIPADAAVLEIGPFANPLLRGNNVKYFDVLSTQAMRARAVSLGIDPEKCPSIDYVSDTGDLAVVDACFDNVISSHAVEHQPDLIRHFKEVGRVLREGGHYFIAVPDKRYCFDHFIAASSIAEVLGAHVRGLRVHDAHSIIEHRALTTHNDPLRHWRGDHGIPAWQRDPEVLVRAAEHVFDSGGAYVDVHAWQFVPSSFEKIARTLYELRLSPLQPVRVYPTTPGSNEFYAVLRHCGQKCSDLRRASDEHGFDPAQYLLANPDVARAGMDPRLHYARFGRREGRKLKP